LPVPESDTALLVARVREAGEIARKYFTQGAKVWRKQGGDPVTEADIAIDVFLKGSLLAARPDYGWLSEESAQDPARLLARRTFIVDPIDGTYGFVKGRPQFTIVAAVVEDGRPQAAAIYNPITEEMFEASLGQGALKNDQRIGVSTHSDFDGARLLAERRFLEPSRWTTPWPGNIALDTRASIAYRMALVAEGAYDAMISLSQKSDWDLAAGDLIVREAGGRVSNEEGASLLYNRERPEQSGVVCAPSVLHARLLQRMADFVPPDPRG
jgi:myo-inositol-1(or 4)-monophosphatase